MSGTMRASYMVENKALPFCPGCGHDRLSRELDRALRLLQLDPRKTVLVTDIGCIGLVDQYFSMNAFHGLHGRCLTYATGLKLARPELTVIALIGDGGCGIGGAHLLNAARRNLDVTLIVANNFNYGMTGGQHSVTTPHGGITATTPAGNIESSIDICATMAAAGAGWACRAFGFDKDLAERIVEAIRHPGFAVLDVWEICTAYYMPRNDFKKAQIEALSRSSGMGMGVVAGRSRPTFEDEYRATVTAKAHGVRPNPIQPKFSHALAGRFGVVLAGSAGQKVRSGATRFAQAGMLAGLRATQKDDYPITVMTGHSVSEIILSPEPIEYTAIDSPDVLIVLSQDGLNKVARSLARLPATSTVYFNDELSLPPTSAHLRPLPLAQIAKEFGRFSPMMAALGAAVGERRLFPLEAFEESCRQFQESGTAQRSIAALRKGASLAENVAAEPTLSASAH